MMKIRIEEIRVGDIDRATGKKVVNVINRVHCNFVRAVLERGGVLEGKYGKVVEILRG